MTSDDRRLPAFGVQVARLAEIRGLDVAALARSVDDTDPLLMRRLASVLDLHESDLCIIAGQPVPDELAPLDPTASTAVDWLAWTLTYVPRAVPDLSRFIRSLPQQGRPAGPRPATPSYYRYPDNVGALVVRLLHNRNLGWTGIVKYLYGVGRGPMLSASTIGMVGQGRVRLTPELLAGLGALLDISPRDLGALTGIEPSTDASPHPDAAEAAALIWNARRLTADQLRQVEEKARVLRRERADELEHRHR